MPQLMAALDPLRMEERPPLWSCSSRHPPPRLSNHDSKIIATAEDCEEEERHPPQTRRERERHAGLTRLAGARRERDLVFLHDRSLFPARKSSRDGLSCSLPRADRTGLGRGVLGWWWEDADRGERQDLAQKCTRPRAERQRGWAGTAGQGCWQEGEAAGACPCTPRSPQPLGRLPAEVIACYLRAAADVVSTTRPAPCRRPCAQACRSCFRCWPRAPREQLPHTETLQPGNARDPKEFRHPCTDIP